MSADDGGFGMTNKRKGQLPSPKQLELLNLMTQFQRDRGYCPSMDEMGQMLGVSKVTVYQHVRALERKGLITRLRHKARSIQVVADKAPAAAPKSGWSLPLMGNIAAGTPIEVYEVADAIDLEQFFAHPERIYALKVEGESMIDEQIRDGDYVVVEPRREATQGETVVARLPDGEITLKKFFREKGRVRLQPANANLKPIYTKQVDILGVVIGLLRKY